MEAIIKNENYAIFNSGIISNKKFTACEKLLQNYLSNIQKNAFANCIPSRTTMAEAFGVHKNTITNSTQNLKNQGLMTSEPRYSSKGRASNHYAVLNDASAANSKKCKIGWNYIYRNKAIKLKAKDKVILIALHYYANAKGVAKVNYDDLAACAGVSRSTAIRIIAQLVKLNVIVKKKMKIKTYVLGIKMEYDATNIYTIQSYKDIVNARKQAQTRQIEARKESIEQILGVATNSEDKCVCWTLDNEDFVDEDKNHT